MYLCCTTDCVSGTFAGILSDQVDTAAASVQLAREPQLAVFPTDLRAPVAGQRSWRAGGMAGISVCTYCTYVSCGWGLPTLEVDSTVSLGAVVCKKIRLSMLLHLPTLVLVHLSRPLFILVQPLLLAFTTNTSVGYSTVLRFTELHCGRVNRQVEPRQDSEKTPDQPALATRNIRLKVVTVPISSF